MSETAPAILWTIRIAAVLYVLAVARRSRWLWTLGCVFYLGHVWAAFALAHHWSHASAWEETARQTEALFGVRSGSGVWWNYVFTVVWTADVAWWWIAPRAYDGRPRWVAITVHGYMAFMFFNGAVVFAHGWVRWLGLAATVWLLLLWIGLRRRRGSAAAIARV